jgi:hypothetical protein
MDGITPLACHTVLTTSASSTGVVLMDPYEQIVVSWRVSDSLSMFRAGTAGAVTLLVAYGLELGHNNTLNARLKRIPGSQKVVQLV